MGPASLPLWLDDPDWYGMNAVTPTTHVTAGLYSPPACADSRRHADLGAVTTDSGPHGAGLTDDEEGHLLDALAAGR